MEKSASPGKSGLLYGVLFGVIMVLEFGYVHNRNAIISRNQRWVIVNIANYLVLPHYLFRMHQLQKNLNNGFISCESLKVEYLLLYSRSSIWTI
jgi:hypothetical protein